MRVTYQTFIRKIRIYKKYPYICGSFIKISIMKKKTKLLNFGNVYAGLTVLVTLAMIYLNVVENCRIPWYIVTAPVWGSLALSLLLIGLFYCIIFYWDKYKKK